MGFGVSWASDLGPKPYTLNRLGLRVLGWRLWGFVGTSAFCGFFLVVLAHLGVMLFGGFTGFRAWGLGLRMLGLEMQFLRCMGVSVSFATSTYFKFSGFKTIHMP